VTDTGTPLRAEIITIGEELLSGDSEIIDTNSIYLTSQLRSIGIKVLFKTTVGDNVQLITDVVKLALRRADVIITTGGLGPTVDDMTRQAIADAVDRPLEFHQHLLDDIAAKFVRFNSRMSENNRIQAMTPAGAIIIENPVGTAPAFIVEVGPANAPAIVSLPGVPREMKYLMEHAIMPYLQGKVGATGIIKNRVIRTAGIGESLVDEKVGDLEKLTNPTVGLAAHSGQTDIRIAARAPTEAEADSMIAKLETEIRNRLGSFIFGVDKETLEEAFVFAARGSSVKIAIYELGTENLLRTRIESQPDGNSLLLPLDAILLDKTVPDKALYRNKSDGTQELTRPGNFKQAVEQWAQTLLKQPNVSLAIAIRSEEGGTAIAVANSVEMRSRTYGYGGSLVEGPEWASGWAMSMGWHMLTSQAGH
jgi:nicotinamide-nucleotide amidase